MKKKAKPEKKLRRVVLGVGHPWFYGGMTQMLLAKADARDGGRVVLHVEDLGAYNRIRLVAEVLK